MRSPIRVALTIDKYISCNFCVERPERTWSISSDHSSCVLVVRICDTCADAIAVGVQEQRFRSE